MRIALVIVILALVGCGKKNSPQAPASGATESTESTEMKQDAEEQDVNAPDQADDAPTTRSADPQEGGE